MHADKVQELGNEVLSVLRNGLAQVLALALLQTIHKDLGYLFLVE